MDDYCQIVGLPTNGYLAQPRVSASRKTFPAAPVARHAPNWHIKLISERLTCIQVWWDRPYVRLRYVDWHFHFAGALVALASDSIDWHPPREGCRQVLF